jgi:hypothetical protein
MTGVLIRRYGEGGRYKERAKESECGGSNMYSCMEMEK